MWLSETLEFAKPVICSFDFAVIHACFISFQGNIKWSQVLILFLNTLKLLLMNRSLQFVKQNIYNYFNCQPTNTLT